MKLWILADIALLALVALLGNKSFKKGFLKSSYAGISSFAALILVFTLHIPFQGYVENSVIGDTVREKIRISVENSVYAGGNVKAENDADTAKEAIDGLKLPEFMTGWIKNAIDTQKQNVDLFKDNLIGSLTDMIFPFVMQILSVLLLYLVIRIGMWLIFSAFRLIFEIPILGMADKLLGAVVGGVNALLIIYIASALLMLLTPVNSMEALEKGINSTYLYKYFYYNNIITNLFFG